MSQSHLTRPFRVDSGSTVKKSIVDYFELKTYLTQLELKSKP